jgi:DNA-binding transcriptional MerR regulator
MVYDNETNQDKNIRGKALYFGTSQVSEMLNITDSRVRYYTNVFDDILHIKISNKQRRYTQADIDKMKFMIELKEDGMSIKQIQEYCQTVDFEDSKEIQIKESNPLSIQTMAKALLEQQAILMNEMKHDIIDSVLSEVNKSLNIQNDNFNNMKNSLSKEVAMTVEDAVDRKLQDNNAYYLNQMQVNLDNMGNKIIENIIEDNTKAINEFKCLTLDQVKEQQESKGIINSFAKFFHSKK